MSEPTVGHPCDHRFCDADGNRVYSHCQRGCGARDIAMTPVQALVRAQICHAIERDLDGGESLMKECFENLPGGTEAEYKVSMDECRAEMRAIVEWLLRDHWKAAP